MYARSVRETKVMFNLQSQPVYKLWGEVKGD